MKPRRDISGSPRDILAYAASEAEAGRRCVLAVIAEIEGPSARAVGAMMAVSEAGEYAGYVSNGCVDADIAQHALTALDGEAPSRVRYGAGSPYLDIRLPCGGAVEVVFVAKPDLSVIRTALEHLNNRMSVPLAVTEDGQLYIADDDGEPTQTPAIIYAPPLQLAISGRGEETIALARLACAAGYGVTVYSPDEEVINASAAAGAKTKRLQSISDVPAFPDDPWSAIVCLFHDHEWETDLLAAAVKTQAFYIGAMGSRRTQEARLEELRRRGVDEKALARIRGPIGLIPSTRDASKLAISVLAEIADGYNPYSA